MHYYKHNIGDYRRRTGHLSLLEHGIYRQLMDEYYLNEAPIPDKTQSVFRRLQARTEDEQTAVRAVLEEFFERGDDGVWRHKHCDEVIAHSRKNADAARANGKLGGRPKKENQSGSKKKPDRKLPTTHNPVLPPNPQGGGDAAFGAFWMQYPRKVGKPVAERAFGKALRRVAQPAEIMAGVERHLPYWAARIAAGEGDKVPHPSTWLNRDGWNDEVPTKGEPPKVMTEEEVLRTRDGILKLAADIGHHPYVETESFPEYRASVLRAAGKLKAPEIGLEELAGMAARRVA